MPANDSGNDPSPFGRKVKAAALGLSAPLLPFKAWAQGLNGQPLLLASAEDDKRERERREREKQQEQERQREHQRQLDEQRRQEEQRRSHPAPQPRPPFPLPPEPPKPHLPGTTFRAQADSSAPHTGAAGGPGQLLPIPRLRRLNHGPSPRRPGRNMSRRPSTSRPTPTPG